MKNKTVRVILGMLPWLVLGLGFLFGVPSYLERAPEWYFELPSVLPPTMWAPVSRVIGLLLMGIAGLIGLFNIVTNTPGKRLRVLIQHSDNNLLEAAAYDIADALEPLMEIYHFEDISVLRGNYAFCLAWLHTNDNRATIVILESAVYRNADTRVNVSITGPARIFEFNGSTVSELVTCFEKCVRKYVAG